MLHKAGYDRATSGVDADAARRWALLQRLPPRALLDPLERAVRFADRREVCQAIAQLAPAVMQPRFVELRRADEALELMEEMRTRGEALDKFTYTSAMNACGKAQRPDRALELLREMQVSVRVRCVLCAVLAGWSV